MSFVTWSTGSRVQSRFASTDASPGTSADTAWPSFCEPPEDDDDPDEPDKGKKKKKKMQSKFQEKYLKKNKNDCTYHVCAHGYSERHRRTKTAVLGTQNKNTSNR